MDYGKFLTRTDPDCICYNPNLITGHDLAGIVLDPTSFLCLSGRWGRVEPGGASDIVKAKSSGEDPRATGGLVSNLPHPRVNKTKQHTPH